MAGAVTSPVAYDLTVAGLPAKVPAGEVTGDVTLSGGILPEKEIGIVWKGAADGEVALILAY